MCKPNMVYTVPPERRGNPCGCPVIPGLGAHKGRPYGCVQDDDSDQANITPPLRGSTDRAGRGSNILSMIRNIDRQDRQD